MSTIPKLPSDVAFDNGMFLLHCDAGAISSNDRATIETVKVRKQMEHYKAVAEAQAELLIRYRGDSCVKWRTMDFDYDDLQRDIEEARKP